MVCYGEEDERLRILEDELTKNVQEIADLKDMIEVKNQTIHELVQLIRELDIANKLETNLGAGAWAVDYIIQHKIDSVLSTHKKEIL